MPGSATPPQPDLFTSVVQERVVEDESAGRGLGADPLLRVRVRRENVGGQGTLSAEAPSGPRQLRRSPSPTDPARPDPETGNRRLSMYLHSTLFLIFRWTIQGQLDVFRIGR